MLRNLLTSMLSTMARLTLKRYSPKVVGVTGSVGKTSTKGAIAAVLATKYRVRENIKSYNNEIGLPLTILGHESQGRSLAGWISLFGSWLGIMLKRDPTYPEVLVLEMGADQPGDITYLTSIAPCDIAVLTAIAPVHLEKFGSFEAIETEKKKIIANLKLNGLAVLNADDERVITTPISIGASALTYGLHTRANVRGSDVHYNFGSEDAPAETSFKVNYHGSVVPVHIRGSVGLPTVYAALAAVAVGLHVGMNLVDIASALHNDVPVPGRLRVLPGIKNTMLIDDTYNSSPRAALTALDLLAEVPIARGAHRYAVLADMLELGAETEARHEEVGVRVAERGIAVLVCVGERARAISRAARLSGMNPDDMFCFGLAEEAARFLKDRIKQHDVILIKGSQGMRMERAVKALMAEPERASELLVRQGQEWRDR